MSNYHESLKVTEALRAFDTDYSGTVDHGEFRRGLSSLGLALDDDEFELVVEVGRGGPRRGRARRSTRRS